MGYHFILLRALFRCGGLAGIILFVTSIEVLAASNIWLLNAWEPPYDYNNKPEVIRYIPVDKAKRPWRLCVSYPHLKDPYWLSVNYGMSEEARRLGVSFRLVEAGGYPNLSNQIKQIRRCIKQGADALIVGTVSFGNLTDEILKISKNIPVIAAVNDIDDRGVSAKVGVSWVEMGRKTGAYLAARHPAGTPPVHIALFPGPKGPEWVDFVMQGFEEALKGSAIEVVVTRRGDTGKEIQRNLVEEVLENYSNLDYLIGTAVTAEAAIGILRQQTDKHKPKIISFYFTHGVFRGIKRGRILAAPTDQPVLQGRLSIETAIRVLENNIQHKHIGPKIFTVTQSNFDQIDPRLSLAPASFSPIFEVEARR